MKKQDRPGPLKFYCGRCFDAVEATMDWKCVCCGRDVVAMRQMIRPNGYRYYVSIEGRHRL